MAFDFLVSLLAPVHVKSHSSLHSCRLSQESSFKRLGISGGTSATEADPGRGEDQSTQSPLANPCFIRLAGPITACTDPAEDSPA